MRKATVEIDKVVGTSWPPASVDKGGQTHTLASIYADAGMDLEVVQHQDELPIPANGPDFDLASLHAYMTEHRKTQTSGWHAHVLVVPNIEYPRGTFIERPLGVMYDVAAADLNNLPREGCAMSARAVDGNKLKYLRTLAHELGHLFNLVHPKEEHPSQPIGTTLMNQTRDLQLLGDYPENIEYRFSDANKDWLVNAPDEFVMPGGRSYAARAGDDSTLAPGSAVATPGLTFEISTKVQAFELGEPVYLRLTLRNDGEAPIEVSSLLSPAAGTVDVWIRAPNHREFRFRPVVALCSEAPLSSLAPKQELWSSEPIFFGARGCSFSKPGVYTLRARFQASVAGQQQIALANEHTIEITRAKSVLNADIAEEIATPSAALYLILQGGAHLRGAEATLNRIVKDAPTHLAAQHARLALAAQALTPATSNLERAARLLGDLRVEQLDRTQRADHQRLCGVSCARRGDRISMNGALTAFENLAKSQPNAERLIKDTTSWVTRARTGSGSSSSNSPAASRHLDSKHSAGIRLRSN